MKKALIFMIAGLLIAMPASAKKKSKKDVESVTKQIQQHQPDAEGFFSDEEIEKIKQYYYGAQDAQSGDAKGKKKKKLPPGLQKKLDRGGQLPPGWQKKVARGEVLDTEVYEQSEILPDDLEKQLPEQLPGTEVIRAGRKVIRVIEATREILDVLDL